MDRAIIYRSKLTGIRPIIWYGQAIYYHHNRLTQVLSEHLSAEHATLLSEPVISQEAVSGKADALWFSDTLKKAVSYTSLSENRKTEVDIKLKKLINDIESLSNNLQQKENEKTRMIGELLLQAIQIPAMDYVYVDGEEICLVCWGFTSDEAIKSNFKLSKVLKKPVTPNLAGIESKPIGNEQENGIDQPVIPEEKSFTDSAPNRKMKSKKWILFSLIGLLFLIIIGLLIIMFLPEKKVLPDKPGLSPVDSSKITTSPADPLKRKILSNRLTVLLKPDVNLQQYANEFIEKYSDDTIHFIGFEPELNLLQVEVPEGDMLKWEKRFREFEGTFNVTKDAINNGSYVPNDSGFQESNSNKYWPLEQIKAFKAWEITKGDSDIIIAVLDSGFDLSHPELNGKIVSPWNAFSKSSQLNDDKTATVHGTHVASIAGGKADNSVGVCGVCPECSIMPVQVGDSAGNIPDSAVISGILYAVKNGANIINMSLGAIFYLDLSKLNDEKKKLQTELYIEMTEEKALLWERVFAMVSTKNIVIVQAAGNNDIYAEIDPMKRSRYAVNVAATDSSKKRASFSNYGEKISLSAPGEKIFNAVPGNNFDFISGTSMASPMVAGAVGLLKSVNQGFSVSDIMKILSSTGEKISEDTSPKYIGPLIRLDAAITRAKGYGSVNDTCNCEAEIYQLQKEIERLKKEIEDLKRKNTTRLKIPEVQPKDFTFAEGRWKSSENLVSTRENKSIMLYFDISKTGKGKITLAEEDGLQCHADISLSFKQRKLIINQLDEAKCVGKNMAYMPYFFECEADNERTAQCKGKPKKESGTGDAVQFYLYKE